MRCPSCNKFATYDTSTEPESELEVSIEKNEDDATEEKADNPATEGEKPALPAPTGEATVRGTARIVLTAECCGDDLKEYTFEIEETVEVSRHAECTCDDWTEDAEVEGTGELTDRQESSTSTIAKRGPKKGQTVVRVIPYRYRKTFYGVSLELSITCGCGKEIGSSSFSEDVQASSMDELT